MGNHTSVVAESAGATSPLNSQYKNAYEDFWSRTCGASWEMTRAQFIASMGKTEISSAIFAYISPHHDVIGKHELESRLNRLLETNTWDGSRLAPEILLGIATYSEKPVPSECDDLQALLKSFPSIKTCLGRAVVNTVLSLISDVGWHRLRIVLPSIDPANASLLFSSSRDGCSFKTLMPAIKHYSGTLVFLLSRKTDPMNVFGFGSTRTEWNETLSFDESAIDTCMFELEPKLAVRRPNLRGTSNYIYCNMSCGTRPVGIGLGGREQAYRLWLDGKNILSVSMMRSDATFEPNHFVSGVTEDFETLDITSVEIWGFSGDDALKKQAIRKTAESETRNERKRVDRSKLVENEFDRNVLLSKTFQSSDSNNRLGNA